MRLSLYKSLEVDPYFNLALEKFLLERAGSDEVILYLWQNENTVVIGRNQSALSECRIQELKKAGGHLARRLSGGGAVYHDLGNLNFTFLAPKDLYDISRQTEVILQAVRMFNINASRSGRNDLLADGHKFSGHAYYHSSTNSYHHGTLLINVDLEHMMQFLNPTPAKLASKGVASVKARVCNLQDLNKDINVATMSAAMIDAFAQEYGGQPSYIELTTSDLSVIEQYKSDFESEKWLLKDEQATDYCVESRFDWGSVRIDFDEENSILTNISLYSDGLDADFLDAIPEVLSGKQRSLKIINSALSDLAQDKSKDAFASTSQIVEDIANLLTK